MGFTWQTNLTMVITVHSTMFPWRGNIQTNIGLDNAGLIMNHSNSTNVVMPSHKPRGQCNWHHKVLDLTLIELGPASERMWRDGTWNQKLIYSPRSIAHCIWGLCICMDVPCFFILSHIGVKYPQEEDCVIFNKSGPTFLMTSRPLVLLHHSWLDVSASVEYHGKGWGPKVCWARRRIGVESWATWWFRRLSLWSFNLLTEWRNLFAQSGHCRLSCQPLRIMANRIPVWACQL